VKEFLNLAKAMKEKNGSRNAALKSGFMAGEVKE
jgi:hypothetical protein